MGYMGFGMKKEVYTRKPKQAYEKFKRVFGNSARYTNREGVREDAEPHSWNALRKRRSLFIKISIILILILTVVLWEPIANWNFKRKRINYEKEKLPLILKAHEPELLTGLEFMGERLDVIYSLKLGRYFDYHEIVLIDKQAKRDDLNSYYFAWKGSFQHIGHPDQITDEGYLVLFLDGKTDTIKRNWSYLMRGVPYDQISPSFLSYMRTDTTELSEFLNNNTEAYLRRMHAKVYTYYESPKYGGYDIIYSKNPVINQIVTHADSSRDRILTGKIDKRIYWRRVERMEDSEISSLKFWD
jgi:hypothetical protein